MRSVGVLVSALLWLVSGWGQAQAEELPETAAADPQAVVQLQRATSPVRIDGTLDEAAWQTAVVIPITHEWIPADNAPPPVATDCLVTFDDERLYVAFRAYDPEPEKIRRHLADRDTDLPDDSVGFLIDTFDDRRRAFSFRVNPLGVQFDAVVSDVDRSEDASWDTIWDSAGRVGSDGYTVEIAVPFRALRFPSGGEIQTWGFLATRSYPRSVVHELRSQPNRRELDCEVCQLGRITGFENLETGYNLEIVPTLTATRTDARPAPGAGLESGDEDLDPGLTVRWGITPSVTLNATVNPDFSQVEADVAQLDVNERFALFFPEKRPFFLEGADFFATPLRAVFTRTVADPSFGLKASGKAGGGAFGAFVAEDQINNLIFPGFESSGFDSIDDEVASAVLRYRRDLGERSTLGTLYTGRQGDDYSNHLYGLDGVLRLTASDTFQFQALGSNTEYPQAVALRNRQPEDRFSGYAWQLDYRHGDRNWFWRTNAQIIDEGFRADSGFVPRAGTEQAFFDVIRQFWGSSDSWYSRLEARVNGIRIQRQNGDLSEQGLNFEFVYQGPYQSRVAAGIRPNKEVFRGVELDNVRGDIRASIRPNADLRAELFLRGGEIVDTVNVRQADFRRIEPTVDFNLGQRISGQLQHTWERFYVGGDAFLDAKLTQTTLRYHFNRRTFLRAILQYRDVERDLALYNPGITLPPSEEELFTQFLFSYKLNPQTVLLAGYSDLSEGNESVDLTQRSRSFFLKVGYAWLR